MNFIKEAINKMELLEEEKITLLKRIQEINKKMEYEEKQIKISLMSEIEKERIGDQHDKKRIYLKEWREKNKEKVSEYNKKYYKNHI